MPTTKYMTSKNGDKAFHQKGTQENPSGWFLVLESHGSQHPLVDSPGKGSHGSSPHQPGCKCRCRKLYILQDKKKSYLGASPARNPFNPLSLNVPITAEPNLVFELIATCIIGKNKKSKKNSRKCLSYCYISTCIRVFTTSAGWVIRLAIIPAPFQVINHSGASMRWDVDVSWDILDWYTKASQYVASVGRGIDLGRDLLLQDLVGRQVEGGEGNIPVGCGMLGHCDISYLFHLTRVGPSPL